MSMPFPFRRFPAAVVLIFPILAWEVLRHDRSRFYGTGFAPEVPVTRTLAALQEGPR